MAVKLVLQFEGYHAKCTLIWENYSLPVEYNDMVFHHLTLIIIPCLSRSVK